ncbi:sulfotransferase [Actinomadura opuntiae]|uniref:sulfotransferase n=1 Tax=Actinomadura sp. OS1-43 TaxID=604315 RepID=UPI00255A85EE|nr:sulfotransferase [Actinomadura sp. OS1-43]MDL4816952.1 sulfotransferase [Actinomadura sp. OS1-43]
MTALLLLGAQRSGTTALAHALSRAYADAGGIFTVNGKLPYLLPRWTTAADLAGRHFRADEIGYALRRRPPAGEGADRWLKGVDDVLRDAAAAVARGAHPAHGGSADPAAALVADIVAKAYAPWRRWGDKYNEYLLDLPAVLAAVPDARLVLLVRNPLEAAASQLEWTGDRPWRPRTVEDACAKWAAWHRPWLETAPGLDPGRLLVIGYRALCEGRATGRLSAFCDLDLGPYVAGLRATRPDPGTDHLPAGTAPVWRALCEMESSTT